MWQKEGKKYLVIRGYYGQIFLADNKFASFIFQCTELDSYQLHWQLHVEPYDLCSRQVKEGPANKSLPHVTIQSDSRRYELKLREPQE